MQRIIEIPLTRGKVALIDHDDFHLVVGRKWHAVVGARGDAYAAHVSYPDGAKGKRLVEWMHKVVVGASAGQAVDHTNGDSLDNRRGNLRRCDVAGNNQNRTAAKGRSSRYQGVSRHGRRWRAGIGYNGKHHGLGFFDTEEEAARTRDVAARVFHGEFARLNFPGEINV